MSEFGDRMRAQRSLLQVVNAVAWPEELFGLSSQAIDRWTDRSSLNPDSGVVTLLRTASERLSFLANRSQSQVSDEYKRVSKDVRNMTRELQEVIAEVRPSSQRPQSRARMD